jgi:hypothetical protein
MKFKVGDRVKMISQYPKYGLGNIFPGDVGTITYIYNAGDIVIDFQDQPNWLGVESELALAKTEPLKEEYKMTDLSESSNV